MSNEFLCLKKMRKEITLNIQCSWYSHLKRKMKRKKEQKVQEEEEEEEK